MFKLPSPSYPSPGVRTSEGIPSVVLVVQSNVVDPTEATARVRDFVDAFGEALDQLTKEQFRAFTTALVSMSWGTVGGYQAVRTVFKSLVLSSSD
jgi:hypothetical protein